MENPFSIIKRLFRNPQRLIIVELAAFGLIVAIIEVLGLQIAEKLSQPLLLIMVSMLLIELVLNREQSRGSGVRNQSESQDLNARLGALTHALDDAGRIISAIEIEIESRQELVGKLESQKAIAENAITLSKEQVDAVAAILSRQVSQQSEKDSRRELIKDILIFSAGIITSLLLHWLGVL
jgi:chromosome segregation ATPase